MKWEWEKVHILCIVYCGPTSMGTFDSACNSQAHLAIQSDKELWLYDLIRSTIEDHGDQHRFKF